MTKWVIALLFILNISCFAEEFYQSRKWLNLLYYEKVGGGYRSLADDDRFFVSPSGKTAPKLEYETSFLLSKEQNSNFRKTFPLRYKLITEFNNLPYIPLVTPNEEINSAMIVFPNRYMSNPASMFGHLFLILKSQHGLMDSKILHYLADTAGSDQYAYVFNGLTGKFKGWFLLEPYYKKIKDYNYVEDRDVTYYDLNLSGDKIQNLQLHAVELKQTYFDYYFLDENCAFFIGKLLNVVLDEDIISRSTLVFPSQIINTLLEKSLLTGAYERNASTELFNEHFSRLNTIDRKAVIDLLLNKTNNPPSNNEVLKTFLYVSEYLINNQSQLAPTIRNNRIHAYKVLRNKKDSNVRSLNLKQDYVSPIKSKGLIIDYGLYDRFFLSYSPIDYGEDESVGAFNLKKMKCLSPRIVLDRYHQTQFGITLISVANIAQSNEVLGDNSWKLNSFLAYQDSLKTDQSFELGRTYRLSEKNMAIGFLGVNYANYNQLLEREMEYLMLRPSLSLGIKRQLIDGALDASFEYYYRYGDSYWQAHMSLKAFFLYGLTYIRGNDFDGIRFTTTYVF